MPTPMRELLDFLRPQEGAMVRLLGQLVKLESPSNNKRATDACGRRLAAEWRRRGAKVKLLRQQNRGDHLRVELTFGRGRPAGQVLLLGHFDTVYDTGTLRRMPFRVENGVAHGPGTFDMKAGLVQALFAVDALRALRIPVARRVVGLWTTDEEIGSETSRAHIEAEARRSDAVLVLEPASGPKGHLKTGRKGVGEAEIIVSGRAAHAGLNPQGGVNAIHELALQIERLMKLNDYERGTTVNVDIIEGGTRTNVIPERARAVVDLRACTMEDARALEMQLRALQPILTGASLEVRGGFDRPPMEERCSAELFARAQALGREIGLELEGVFVGGGSDGNFTAALGIPTLDGLGPVGDGAHSATEHVITAAMPERAALLAGLLATL